MSRQTLAFTAAVIRRHRASIGSLWRKLDPGRQALLVLVHLRKGEPFAQVAAGFGVGTATAWRYVTETVALLAARAPGLRQAVRAAKRAGFPFVVVDGTLARTDRVAANRPSYSGKHKKHGMNLQVIASPDGDILWVSGALPGSVHDKKAEWIWGVLDELQRQGLITLADKGYQGSTRAKVPYRGKNKPEPRKEANRAHARLRAPGERAAQDLEDPPEAALLPVARRETRQSHPRIAAPRGITRLETAQCTVSAMTLRPTPPTTLGAEARQRSREKYGRSKAVIRADIAARRTPKQPPAPKKKPKLGGVEWEYWTLGQKPRT